MLFKLPKNANGSNSPPVDSESKSSSDGEYLQQPIVARGQGKWKRKQHAGPFREYAHEANHVRAGRLPRKRLCRWKTNNIPGRTDHSLGLEGQPAEQFGAQLCLAARLPDHKGPGRANVDHVVLHQLLRENGGPEKPVASYVNSF